MVLARSSGTRRHYEIQSMLAASRPRVRVRVHPLYLPDRDVRINLGRDDRRVTEQPLNYPNIGAVLEHVRCR
jgi:hypothetical protein